MIIYLANSITISTVCLGINIITMIIVNAIIPWFVLSGLSSFSVAETLMRVHLDRTFICPDDIFKAICCLIQVLHSPFQSLHFIGIPYKLAIGAPTKGPAKLLPAPNDSVHRNDISFVTNGNEKGLIKLYYIEILIIVATTCTWVPNIAKATSLFGPIGGCIY